MTVFAWPTLYLYIDTSSAPLSLADWTARATAGFGLPVNALPDIGAQLLSFSTTRGRQNSQSHFDTGTATFELDNRDGRFDPSYTSSPFYPNLGVGNHLYLIAYDPGVNFSYSLWSGYIDSLTPAYDYLAGERMIITASDMFKMLNLLLWQPTSPVAAQNSLDRCRQILTDCGFTTNWVTLDGSGITPVSLSGPIGVDPTTGLMAHSESALSAMQASADDTEDGMVYVRADGWLVVSSRYARPAITNFMGLGAAFGDSAGEILYEPDVSPTTDDTLLVNMISITDGNGTVATYSDAASIAKYGPRAATLTSLTVTPNEVDDQAALRVQEASTLQMRVDQLTFKPVYSTTAGGGGFDAFNTFLLIEDDVSIFTSLGVTIKRRPASGNTITLQVFIERSSHSFDGESWTITYGFSPATTAVTSWWVVGTGTLGTSSGSLNTMCGR